MSSFFSNISKSLAAAGVSASDIPSVLSSLTGTIRGMLPSNSITQKLNQISVVAGSPAAVAALVNEIEGTPGVPPSAIGMLESLKNPGLSPQQIFETIRDVEAAISAA